MPTHWPTPRGITTGTEPTFGKKLAANWELYDWLRQLPAE